MSYKDIIEELNRKIPATKIADRSRFRRIWSYRNGNINNWYLVHLKAFCYAYNVEGMEDYSIPKEINGIKVFYAFDDIEVDQIVASDKKRVHYNNNMDTSDESFIKWTSADYKRTYSEEPKFAVLYANDIWYISEERFRIAEQMISSKNLEPKKQEETESKIE